MPLVGFNTMDLIDFTSPATPGPEVPDHFDFTTATDEDVRNWERISLVLSFGGVAARKCKKYRASLFIRLNSELEFMIIWRPTPKPGAPSIILIPLILGPINCAGTIASASHKFLKQYTHHRLFSFAYADFNRLYPQHEEGYEESKTQSQPTSWGRLTQCYLSIP